MRSKPARGHNPRVSATPGLRTPALGPCLALFAGVFFAVLAVRPERTYGDDVFFVWVVVFDRVFTAHFLFAPVAKAWTAGLAQLGCDPLEALRWLSNLAAALAAVLLAAAARRRGAGPAASAVLALLVITAASTWFYAGAGEVHMVQLAACALLAWTLAGLGPEANAGRFFALALVFGLAVGAHRSDALLLPGVVLACLWATRGRPDRRAWKLAAFALGGALALGGMMLLQSSSGGQALGEQDSPLYWLKGLGSELRQADPRTVATFWASEWIAPAFPLTFLAAVAVGGLLRRRPAPALAGVATVLPHALFFPLFGYEERGAYYIVTLPVFTWLIARAWNAAGEAQRSAPQGLWTAGVLAVAAAGACFTPEELLARVGSAGLLGLVAVGFAGGLALPRPGGPGWPRATWLGLALAGCQLVGSQRCLASWDRGTPLLDWGRDTVAATGPDSALILTGFQRYMLALLLARPWPEPYADTWEYQRDLGTLGPAPFDIGAVAPQVVAGTRAQLAENKRVFALKTVFRHFEWEPLRGAHVRELRAAFDLAPLRRGAFDGYELTPKDGQ